MSVESPCTVLPFPHGRHKGHAPGDVLSALRDALQGAPAARGPGSIQASDAPEEAANQAAVGDWNLQISEDPAARQYIRGNNNVQISGAQVTLRLHLRVKR